jgi:thiamine-monophosphate kinase
MTTLEDLGESAVIAEFQAMLSSRPDVVTGPGDDCAVVRTGNDDTSDLLLTSDPVIEGIHFKHHTEPCLIGRKAIGRALSDIAAMGGTPAWALVNLSAPRNIQFEITRQIVSGAEELAAAHELAIVGGDLAEGPVLQLNVFAVGTVPRDTAVLRSGAKPNHSIFVTGSLGGSILGKHLDFSPRVQEGSWLREHGASAMIDLSDGLSEDLRRICGMSQVGAVLDAQSIPIADGCGEIDEHSDLEHALNDGEDFELLFTIDIEDETAFLNEWQSSFETKCTKIGNITDVVDEVELVEESGEKTLLLSRGFGHFQ